MFQNAMENIRSLVGSNQRTQSNAQKHQALARIVAKAGVRLGRATLRFELHGNDEEQWRQRSMLREVEAFCKPDVMKENVRNARNVVCFGPCGTGKDHITIAMLKHAIAAGFVNPEWISGVTLFGLFRKLISSDGYESRLRELRSADILVISDLLPTNEGLTDWQATNLFELIDSRWRKERPTWVNLNVASREEMLAKIGEKILSRLEYRGLIMRFAWGDYRPKAA